MMSLEVPHIANLNADPKTTAIDAPMSFLRTDNPDSGVRYHQDRDVSLAGLIQSDVSDGGARSHVLSLEGRRPECHDATLEKCT